MFLFLYYFMLLFLFGSRVSSFWFLSPEKPKLPDSCGISSISRIVGGIEAEVDQWPWVVSIISLDSSHICGGTVITERSVLTAAHCVGFFYYLPFLLKVGMGNVTKLEGKRIRVSSVIVHPDFRSEAFYESDIAVLILSETILFDKSISPVCLPSSVSREFSSSANNEVTVVGWGRLSHNGPGSKTLQWANIQTLEPEACSNYKQQFTTGMICAGQPSGGIDACQGDSGGPLLKMTDGGLWVQIGIVSFGLGCADPLYPGVYTNVTIFEKWLLRHIY